MNNKIHDLLEKEICEELEHVLERSSPSIYMVNLNYAIFM